MNDENSGHDGILGEALVTADETFHELAGVSDRGIARSYCFGFQLQGPCTGRFRAAQFDKPADIDTPLTKGLRESFRIPALVTVGAVAPEPAVIQPAR